MEISDRFVIKLLTNTLLAIWQV